MFPVYFMRRLRKNLSGTVRQFCASSTTPKEAKELGSQKENNPYQESYGQPTPQTHSHLLAKGEILPGIQKDEFIQRREKFIRNIFETAPGANHIVIVPSASKVYMSEKIPYVFRQNTDFLYLTGCMEPDCALVITASKEDNAISTLFLRDKDKHSEKWDGPRTGVEGAPRLFGVNQALPFKELNRFLSSYAHTFNKFTLWYDYNSCIHPDVHSVMKSFSTSTTGKTTASPKTVIHQQRLIKSAAEQKLMARTCDIACSSMKRTMGATYPGITEHTLFAKMDYECRASGADFLAYPPVVASGNNANTIHYIANLQKTEPGEMVLMDAGCSVSGYCSDLTRTWPVSGRFTPAQQVLYEIVLTTQAQLLAFCHPHHSLDHIFNVMIHVLGQKLIDAGVFKKSTNTDFPAKLAYDLCPHHASHYLGMDVHDTGSISRNIAMRPGMVITVEPGLYVSEHNKLLHEEFCGQGIRIEDNILITDTEPVVLTRSCPKEIEEIEKIVGSNLCT